MTSGVLCGDNRCGGCGADYILHYLLPALSAPFTLQKTMSRCKCSWASQTRPLKIGELLDLQAWVDKQEAEQGPV